VLSIDDHDSHDFMELISIAMKNQIEIVELSAHT